MTRPTISYTVTLYNKAPYLPHMLAGLSSQQGTFNKQFIFVDDGSTDDTVLLLRRLTERWKNVTIIEQDNFGPSVAMNRGFAASVGEYIKPVDGDDMLVPWATEYLLRALQEQQCDVAYANMKMQGRYPVPSTPAECINAASKAPLAPVREMAFLKKALKDAHTGPPALLATRQIILSCAGGGADEGVFVQDYSLELKLAASAEIVRVDNRLFLMPDHAPGRLSESGAQTLHDMNLAVVRFLRTNPNLPYGIRHYGLHRIAKRAWTWARRHGRKAPISQEFATSLLTLLGLCRPTKEFEDAVCRPFRETDSIRLMSSRH